MENSRIIFMLSFLLICNFANISLARVLPGCNDVVYEELGIAKVSDVFCEMIDLEIIYPGRVTINRHSQSPMTLSLNKTEGVLINENTPILSHHEFTKGNLNWCHLTQGITTLGDFSMFHNYQEKAAFVFFGNETDGVMEGVIGDDEIRYLPVLRQYILLRAKYTSITTFDKGSRINTSPSAMYYKILILLDHSYVEGKTQIQALRSALVYWNIVDMYYRLYFLQPKIKLNIAGIILPHKSSPHLNTTVDRDISTIQPLNMAVYLSGESDNIPTDIYDAIITMTKLPVCVNVKNYNQCPDSTYRTSAKVFMRDCNRAHESVKDFSGVIQCNAPTLDDYIGTALHVKNGFLADIDDCVEDYSCNKHKNLRNYPRTLEKTFVSATNVCPGEVSPTSLRNREVVEDEKHTKTSTSEFIPSTTPSFIVRPGPPETP